MNAGVSPDAVAAASEFAVAAIAREQLQEDFDAVRQWLGSWRGSAIDASLVPGADHEERLRLDALGSLAGAVFEILKSVPLGAISLESLPPGVAAWMSGSGVVPEEVVLAFRRLVGHPDVDYLARSYAWAVSRTNRRNLGTYFTPPDIVEWMLAEWEARYGLPRTVIDVGAGVGAFTIEMARRWPAVKVQSIDINVATLGLLALRIVAETSDGNIASEQIVLNNDDYVRWLNREWSSLGERRVIFGNPPYTRMQLLSVADRTRFRGLANLDIGKRASLSTIMTAASLHALAANDGLCFLLPAQWLEADYAAALRKRIWDMSKRAVGLTMFSSDVFEDADVDAVALFVGPESAEEQEIVFSQYASSAVPLVGDRGRDVPKNWRHQFASQSRRPLQSDATRLGVLATVKRGTATGANRFFILSEASRELNELPVEAVFPLIHRLKEFEGFEITSADIEALDSNKSRWLFQSAPASAFASVREYVRTGEKSKLDEGVLCSSRSTWYDLRNEIRVPAVVIGPASKGAFRFVTNSAQAAITNNLYGLDWKDGVDPRTQTSVLSWMRSIEGQDALRKSSRTRGRGLLKVEPGAFSSIAIPNHALSA